MAEDYLDDYWKWYKYAYEQRYGKGSWERDKDAGVEKNKDIQVHRFQEFRDPSKTYWNDELAVGVLQHDNKFIGVACLVAKEVVDKDSFVEKFGLGFGGDVHWKAAPVLLDHLSRSPMFKAVLVTLGKLLFKLEPDIPEELQGRLNWAKRNYEYHTDKANSLKLNIEQQEQSGTLQMGHFVVVMAISSLVLLQLVLVPPAALHVFLALRVEGLSRYSMMPFLQKGYSK